MKKLFGVLAVLGVFAVLGSGCGFIGERAKYARVADHVNTSVTQLNQTVPDTDPRKPGLMVLNAETKGISEALPTVKPEEKLAPIPFVSSVSMYDQTKAAALSNGATPEQAASLAMQAAAAPVAGQSEKIQAAIGEYKAAATSADTSSGIFSMIFKGLSWGLGLLGPWGQAGSILLGAGTAIYQAIKKRSIQDAFDATVRGVEAGMTAIKDASKAGPITFDAVKTNLYSALTLEHEALPNADAVQKQVTQIKAEARTA